MHGGRGSARAARRTEPGTHWEKLFAAGNRGVADAGTYPSLDEVVGVFRRLRADNLKLLDAVGESRLDRVPMAIPPGFEEGMKTFSNT